MPTIHDNIVQVIIDSRKTLFDKLERDIQNVSLADVLTADIANYRHEMPTCLISDLFSRAIHDRFNVRGKSSRWGIERQVEMAKIIPLFGIEMVDPPKGWDFGCRMLVDKELRLVFVQSKSCNKWSNADSRSALLKRCVRTLHEHSTPDMKVMVVIGSDHGDGRDDTEYHHDGFQIREMYGPKYVEFFTGDPNTLDVIEDRVAAMQQTQSDPIERLEKAVRRTVLRLVTEIDDHLITADYSPNWPQLLHTKQSPPKRRTRRKLSGQADLFKLAAD